MMRALKVCTKAENDRKTRHKNHVLVQIINKVALKIVSLDVSKCIS